MIRYCSSEFVFIFYKLGSHFITLNRVVPQHLTLCDNVSAWSQGWVRWLREELGGVRWPSGGAWEGEG